MRYPVLNRNAEFRRAYQKGKSFVSAQVVLYVNQNRCGKVRLGLTATKKIGKATVRNRAKRVMGAAIQNILKSENLQKQNIDIVLVARALTPKLKSTQIEATLRKMMIKGGILQAPQTTNENKAQESTVL